MEIITNPITVSVLVMCILCLFKINVLLSLIVAAIVAGTMSGVGLGDTFGFLISGMGGNAETALSYILLGSFAAALSYTGIADILSEKISNLVRGRRIVLLLVLVVAACLSGTVIPVHIAFIPILVPPLLMMMNKMKLDRRGAACALAFGLKCPYITLPIGYGLIFQGIVATQMTQNGMAVQTLDVWKSNWILGVGMILGLVLSIIAYKKNREYKDINIEQEIREELAVSQKKNNIEKSHVVSIAAIIATLAVQLKFGSMPLGAVTGFAVMIIFGAVKISDIDHVMGEGIKLMGLIAFVMLVASGYGNVIKQIGAVESLVSASVGMLGGSKAIAAFVMIMIGLITTMGIGTSFGTVPILAVLYVPMAIQLGFSPQATIVLISAAAALGDAGSPASDTTLGPTAGLNADGQHDHIWDTCVPTFIYYNIPLVIFGFIGAMIF